MANLMKIIPVLLVACCLQGQAGPPPPTSAGAATGPAAPAPAGWNYMTTHQLPGVKVSLSRPVLVTRSKGHCWFPSLARLPDGRLLAWMSTYADVHTDKPTAQFCWSRDGGLSWSVPVPGAYGDCPLALPGGELVLLPYYMFPRPEGAMGAPYQVIAKGGEQVKAIQPGVTVAGWPRPDRTFDPRVGMSGFVFNGQTLRTQDDRYLANLYGYFKEAKRYSLVAAESQDGVKWKIRSVVADETCELGSEGPCEAAMCRLADRRLMCVFRTGSFYGRSYSRDEGRTWDAPVALAKMGAVQPSLAVLPDGMIALSGGRPGLFLWLSPDKKGQAWHTLDLQAHHNAAVPAELITKRDDTSSYTEVVALDASHLLIIYDRIPHGWGDIPAGSPDTNSVWVVKAEVKAE